MASIDKRPNGRYRVRWRTPDGRQHARHFALKVEAERHRNSVAADLDRGAYVDPKAGRETIRVFAERWSASQVWRDSSRTRMEHIISAQINPTFGSIPLASLRRSEVRAWVADMNRHLAASTVVSYYRCLAAIMKSAVDDGLIVKSPCLAVKLPRRTGSTSALVPLDVEQVHRLADAMPERYRTAVLVQAGLGLRQGELCGLTADRVDFLRSSVRVDRQLLDAHDGRPIFGAPKTQASVRVIPLPNSVRDVLAVHMARFGPNEDGLIFTTSEAGPLRRSTYSRFFRRAAAAAGVSATSHDLRHHAASALIRAGCSVKAVQAYLGHATAAESLDTYGHLWPDDHDRIKSAIDAVLEPSEDSLRTASGLAAR